MRVIRISVFARTRLLRVDSGATYVHQLYSDRHNQPVRKLG
jgi:hypothetical protein